jgi:arginine N-succinyltransferase
MFLIRSVEKKDVSDIIQLAKRLNSYNLPAEPSEIKRLIRDSIKSFRTTTKSSFGRKYLFVIENTKNKKIAGCSLLISRRGSKSIPHLSFDLKFEKRTSMSLKRTVKHYTLKLTTDLKDYTEIGGLIVLSRYRSLSQKLGKQLSYIRFAYMSKYIKYFCPRVIVVYLPKHYGRGGNIIWEALGRRFTNLSYDDADKLSVGNKEFILSLFPKEKIYCSVLPEVVVRDLGVPSPSAEKSLRMLQKIGFKFLRKIDPFDGGPHYGTNLLNISPIKRTIHASYDPNIVLEDRENHPSHIVMNDSNGRVRALLTECSVIDKSIALPQKAIDLLHLKGGEKITITPFDT